MTPSITIHIDLGAEGGAASRVSTSGSVPAPISLGGSMLAASGGAIGTIPSPAGIADQIAAQADTATPAPMPTLLPQAITGGSGIDDAPTPFSASSLSSGSAGQSSVAPTPFDSAHGVSVGVQAPTPSLDVQGQADLAPPSPRQPDGPADKKSRK